MACGTIDISQGGDRRLRTAFFTISSDTDGQIREVSGQEFDKLVRERASWGLFAAVRGDLAWACGGEMPEEERDARRGGRIYTPNVVPIVQLARTGTWLTPSQAAVLRAPAAVPDAAPDMGADERYRKALEKGRRAVDICLEKRGKVGVWRVIETGPAAGNGERRYRFKRGATDLDGEPVRYCVAWAEDVDDDLVFVPKGDGADTLPLCDGSWGLMQVRGFGLKLTIRDVVWSGLYDEISVLADARNERDVPLRLRRVRLAVGDGVELPASQMSGPRVRAWRADVVRWPQAREDGKPVATLEPGGVAHFGCWTWHVWPVLGRLERQVVQDVSLRVEIEGSEPITCRLGLRVDGAALFGRLTRVAGGWAVPIGAAAHVTGARSRRSLNTIKGE